MLYQHITVYSSTIKFTRLIPRNVYVQAEGMLKPMETLLNQNHVERILFKKLSSNFQPLLLGENYTEL